MMYGVPFRNSGTPASCGNRTGGVASYLGADVSIVPTEPPAREPVRLGDALPDVLAEVRRLQKEAGR